jgi:hypothetical protein
MYPYINIDEDQPFLFAPQIIISVGDKRTKGGGGEVDSEAIK